jgi:hypothetical protein
MDQFKHAELLKLQSSELTGRTPFCPEDQQIAGYFEGGLPGDERVTLEMHLADCRYCQARIGLLNQLEVYGDSAPVSELDLAAAKQLGNRVHASGWKRKGQWAAAAMVVIAVASVINYRLSTGEAPGANPAAEAGRQLRSIDRNATRLDVLIDAPSSAVTAGSSVRWAEVSGNIHYNVYVLSADGDVLLKQRTSDTEWILQRDLRLTTGDDYFLRIEAVLPDGGTLNSRHIHFKASAWR